MSNADYLISTTYLKLLLNEPDLVEILRRTIGDSAHDLSTQELLAQDYLHSEQAQPIFEAFAAAGLESWLLKFGQRLGSTTHGPLGFAVLSAPNLRTALEVLSDYAQIRTTAYSHQLLERDNRLYIIAHDHTESPLIGRWLIETGMHVAQRLIENVMAHPLGDNALIRFAHAAPDYSTKLQAYFNVPIEYAADENSFSIPASWGQLPSPLSDPGTFESNLNKCKEINSKLGRTPNLLESVQIKLDHFFIDSIAGLARPRDLPTLNSLATEFALSSRTFARRLEELGSSYQQELAEHRQKHAKALLLNTHLRVADIAYYLAYQEPANFTRAFKSWFATTPKLWRQRCGNNKASEEASANSLTNDETS